MLRTTAHILLVAGCLPVFAATSALAQVTNGESASSDSLLMDQSTLPNAIEIKGPRPKADPSVIAPAATTLPEDLEALSSPDSLALPDLPSQVTIRELRPLTLQEVERLVEVNNPGLKAAASQVEQAKSELLAAISLWYPTVNLTANGLPQYLEGEQYRNPDFVSTFNQQNPLTGESFSGRDPNTYTRRWSANFSAQVQWNLIDPSRVPQIAAARDSFEKASDTYLIALRELRLQASTSYFELQRQDEQVRIGQQSVRASLVSLSEARARYQAGVANKLEVLEAQTQLSRDRLVLTNALAAQSSARRSLASLLDLPQDVTPTAADPTRVLGTWQPSLQESIIAAYAFREELDRFILDISINNSRANTALAAVQPVLSIFNSFDTARNQGQSNQSGSIDLDDYNWNYSNAVGLSATWNIFDGGRARAQYRQNKQRAEESKYNFASERDRIRSEVEDSFFNLRRASQNIHTSTSEVLTAAESLRIARLRFQAGVTTQREVVETQRDLTDAQVRYANAINAYNVSIAELRRRTGLDQVLACPALNLPATKPTQADIDVPIEPQPNRPPCEAPVPVFQS
ncbi:possible RND family outer membrane efflux protein [Synechococcus sp. CC9311]|nr:possible RND family outer membrane efflux protein [Synechococcus sp. CC9311]